ncbi:MAG: hypothetical protein J2P17_31740, partial [Mycobacterium sp.]|nr:hypothetical protein [Mycobacterium sp.]
MAAGSLRRHGWRILLAVCAFLLVSIPGARASATAQTPSSLWPRFSAPKVIFAVDVQKMNSTDLLTATTLEGIYNAQNRPSRLYLIQ